MANRIFGRVVAGVLALAPGCAAPAGNARARPMLLAYYYTWYSTGFGPHGVWNAWNNTKESEIYPKGCDPDKIIFPPAIREISSCAYPLIGPYDSDNPDVVRWHIRLAKAAGIDGFLVDWWGPGTWQNPSGLTRNAFEKAILPAAEAEGFKVCLFDETPQFHDDLEQTIAWAADFLGKYKDSPAYLKIDGKPVYCIYQLWGGRLKPEEGQRFIHEVEAQVGPVYWVFDRVQASDATPAGASARLFLAPGWEQVEGIDAICMYSTFSSIRTYDRSTLTRLYTEVTRQVHATGRKIMLPAHPGLDNRKIQIDPVAKPKGEPHWGIPRRNGQTLKDYLDACTAAGADMISITSFNEWPETTVVEPALTWPDPYLYLKILAEFRGIRWRTPTLPPPGVLDQGIRELRMANGRQQLVSPSSRVLDTR